LTHGVVVGWSPQGYDRGGGGSVRGVTFERVFGQHVHTGIVVDLLLPEVGIAIRVGWCGVCLY
jgi:hypothetical protein